jgi:hypothetical protein
MGDESKERSVRQGDFKVAKVEGTGVWKSDMIIQLYDLIFITKSIKHATHTSHKSILFRLTIQLIIK